MDPGGGIWEGEKRNELEQATHSQNMPYGKNLFTAKENKRSSSFFGKSYLRIF